MERLTTRDQRTAQEFVREIYRLELSGSMDSWMEGAISKIAKLIPIQFTTCREGIRSNPRPLPRRRPAVDNTLRIRERWAQVADQHPLITHFVRKDADGTAKISDLMTLGQFHRSELYNEFYRLLGVEDVLAVQMTISSSLDIGIGLHRDRPFSEREHRLLDLVRPHLAQAYESAVAAERLDKTLSAQNTALECAGLAVLRLTRERGIRFSTDRALKWISEYLGSTAAANHRLPEVLDLWVRQHDFAMRQILELPKPRDPLVIMRGDRRLIVRLLSGDVENLLLLEEQEISIDPLSLRSLALTRRESEVLAHMANGRRKDQVAHILGTSVRTVDTHVQNMMRKLKVSSITSAIAKAFQASRLRGGSRSE